MGCRFRESRHSFEDDRLHRLEDMGKHERFRLLRELIEAVALSQSEIDLEESLARIEAEIQQRNKYIKEHPEQVFHCYTYEQFIDCMKQDDDTIYVFIGNGRLSYNVRRYLGRKRRKSI